MPTAVIGGGRFRLKMNGFTWGDTLPSDMDKFAPGNLIAMEQGGRGGFEMRHNHGVKCVVLPCLAWTFCSAAYCKALLWAPGPCSNADGGMHAPVICSAPSCLVTRLSSARGGNKL